jgi:hypothetical protein
MVRKRRVKILPDIKAWSDVTFVEWQTQAQNANQDVKQLKYVFRYQIANKEATKIIKAIAGSLLTLQWPGVTFPMTNEDGSPNENGRAILGTPNGLGVAYLLSTHKAQLGHKTIESVHVWSKRRDMGVMTLDVIYAVFKIIPWDSSSGPSTD